MNAEIHQKFVSSQADRVNAVIAREPKRLRQSPNQIAASPPAPRNDICFNKIYSMHGVIEILRKFLEIADSVSPDLQSALREIGPIPFPNRKERGLAFFLAPAVRGLMITLLAVLSACSGDPDNPEEQIREMIAAGEEAVETRSIMTVLDFIANDYQDKRGRQKKDIQRLVAGYILRNKSIHLLTRVQHVALSEDKTQADVILYVGMAGVPVTSVDQLLLVRADLYRFDLSVKLEDGDWRVAAGSWQQARLADF